MGNKHTSPPKGPDTGTTKKAEAKPVDSATEKISGDKPSGPSVELLASLQALGENSDYTLLPYSLHQIAKAYQLKQNYHWAIQFLQLEKLYHERLLSNLSALEEDLESQWKKKERKKKHVDSRTSTGTDGISREHIETLSRICRTHHSPTVTAEKSVPNVLKDIQSIVQQQDRKSLQFRHDKVMKAEAELRPPQREGGEEAERKDEEAFEERREDYEETPEEEEVKVEWPTGVPQASDKDLAKLSNTEGSSSADGLVSILKRRRASLDGLPPASIAASKGSSKRKVHFSEPGDGTEQDEVGGDSCLILLLLCVVTVVISIGGTALYCTLEDTYSNICTDFSQNVNFYVTYVQSFFDGLSHWLPFQT
ncbi:hypothetical protein LDENG_00000510 [Lucifuga dentata]|nr:hypothetical protein LDENG_00000510 [Lucifuga dentata]